MDGHGDQPVDRRPLERPGRDPGGHVVDRRVAGAPDQAPARAHHEPGRAPGQPTIYTIALPGGRQLQTYVDPGTPGPNTIHYTFFDASGNEQPIARATASAEAPSGATTDTKLLRFTAGHFAANVTLGAGRWIFFIDATTDDGTALTAYFAQTIGQ